MLIWSYIPCGKKLSSLLFLGVQKWPLNVQYCHIQRVNYQLGCVGPCPNRICLLGAELLHGRGTPGPYIFCIFFSLFLWSRPKWPVLYHVIWPLIMQYGHTQQTSYQMGCSGPLGNRKCPLELQLWHLDPTPGTYFFDQKKENLGGSGGGVVVVVWRYNHPGW